MRPVAVSFWKDPENHATASHLLKERHGELLVRDAVSGRADVLFGLVCDVEVDPHQDVFLQRTEVNV